MRFEEADVNTNVCVTRLRSKNTTRSRSCRICIFSLTDILIVYPQKQLQEREWATVRDLMKEYWSFPWERDRDDWRVGRVEEREVVGGTE